MIRYGLSWIPGVDLAMLGADGLKYLAEQIDGTGLDFFKILHFGTHFNYTAKKSFKMQ